MNSRPREPQSREALCLAAEAYLDALEAGGPSRLPWRGDGSWNRTSKRRCGYDLKSADLQQGQVGWFGVVEEHGFPPRTGCGWRSTTRVGSPKSRRSCAARSTPAPFRILRRSPSLQDLAQAQRRQRARMISIAVGYFDTLQLNDVQLFTEFTEDCDRIEDGQDHQQSRAVRRELPDRRTGLRQAVSANAITASTIACATGASRWWTRKEEKGLVLAGGFIDHQGRLLDITWTDGTQARTAFHYPHSFVLLELFKIVDGKIAGVEAVFLSIPHNMPCAWSAPAAN